MIAALAGWLLLAGAFAPAQAELRVGRARVLLEGPVSGLLVETRGPGPTQLEGTLAAGERRELDVPLLLPPGPLPALEFRHRGDGSAHFVRWVEADAGGWERLPPGLRARPASPLVQERELHPPPSAVLAAVAGVLFVLALGRRPAVAAGAGLAAFALVLALAGKRAEGAGGLRILEGDLATGRFLAQDVHAGAAPLAERLLEIQVEPPGAPVRLVGSLEGGSPWRVVSPGAILRLYSEVEPGERRLSAERNGWGALEGVFVRSPDGRWTARGSWPLGAPLPPPSAEAEPPGWIHPALPMGTGILIGRFAGHAWTGEEPSPPRAWVRASGLVGD